MTIIIAKNNSKEILSIGLIDENYMIELDTKLSNMKKVRKDTKSQAKMLNNRINMSKNQERKNLRKIECGKKSVNDNSSFSTNGI